VSIDTVFFCPFNSIALPIMNKKYILPLLVIASIIIIDQWTKLYIKNHFYIGEEIAVIGNWFKLHFTENYGMAFGIEFGGKLGKVLLTLFRIIFVGGILWYILDLLKKNAGTTYVLAWTMIAAGAIGNIIDSVFFGVLFQYDTWFHGRVVDMFYFPLFQTTIPRWFPFWAGEEFEFFRPVFNIADAAISVGFVLILLFQKQAPVETNSSGAEIESN
jgi:signal peptidase II